MVMVRVAKLIPSIVIACLMQLSSVLAEPAVAISEPVFDFGRVAQYAVVSHRFWVRSVGDDTLRITKVVSGCGCTRAPLKDSVLAAGDSTVLEIFFSTKSYRGFLSKKPYIETNVGGERTYVKIKSELLPEPDEAEPISLRPYRLDVSQYKPKPRRRAKFYIYNKDTADYAIKLIDYASHVFDVTLPDIVKAGDSARGVVVVHDDALETEFEHSLTFEIDDENKTRYTLPVKRLYRVRDRSGE